MSLYERYHGLSDDRWLHHLEILSFDEQADVQAVIVARKPL
jgi:hypothetical protein